MQNSQLEYSHFEQFFQLDWDRYKTALKVLNMQTEEAAYNLVSVSTYSGHLENYHSDIWGFLLDPSAVHCRKSQFLHLFLKYLFNLNILDVAAVENLSDARLYREKGRMDILIVNEEKGVCVIIENKINNAVDQKDQLRRYSDKAKENGWKEAAILYVTATGAGLTTIEGDTRLIHPLAVANDTKNDIVNGWIIPCKESIPLTNASENENIRSFLQQYILLLKHLTLKKLSNMSLEILYEFLKDDSNKYEIAELIHGQFLNINLERAKIFSKKMEEFRSDYFKPAFHKKFLYGGFEYHLIFEGLKHNGHVFKFNINHTTSYTEFEFFDTTSKLDDLQTKQALNEIIGNNEFGPLKGEKPKQISYVIRMDEKNDTLSKLDSAVLRFSKDVFEKFNEFAKQKGAIVT